MPNQEDISNAAAEWTSAERRKHRRLAVRLDILVRPYGAAGQPMSAVEKATTHDISPGDMYFVSSLADRLEMDDRVDVDIEVPAQGTPIFGERHLRVSGRVARLDPPGPGAATRRGVAIVFDQPPAFRTATG
jgi:hypothetical protein